MERVILNYAILQNIRFDVGKIIKEAIWDNRDGRKNLGYPFLIYQLCKNVGVEISNQEEWFHVIKSIQMKKKGKGTLPQPEGNIDSEDEATSEEEEEKEDEEGALKPIHHHEEESSTSHHPIEKLTTRVDAFWDEHQEFQVSVNLQLDEIKAQNDTILRKHNTISERLAQLLSFHTSSAPPHRDQ